ncbi:hypothetical protein WCE39_11620 [Luteimonas sp. MJ174]|uniref:hypothetical protein n=1 Tax=Luteimonas sp. MJ174 TaxID=3129237 RepID=UPI0031BBC0E9
MNANRMDVKERLRTLLLSTTSTRKHSAYQMLPTRLADFIGSHGAQLKPKRERERLEYLSPRINFRNKTALDIGSNIGYFTFELLDAGCSKVTAYEGGDVHCEFLSLAVKALGNEGQVSVQHEYFDFLRDIAQHDIALLLNVVHHTGDDYGDACENIEEAKLLMLEQLNLTWNYADILIFQMGFNWKGDISRCLFPNGTKQEMIDFISRGTVNRWEVEHIGIAEKFGDGIRYADLNRFNINRDDSLGEFLNRPIFIMRAKRPSNPPENLRGGNSQ